MTAMHPEYIGVWCPTCKQDCLPLPNGRCGWCDTRVADTDGTPLTTAPTSDHEPKENRVATCKIDGCTNPDAGKGGWCVGLCNEHVSEEARRRQHVRRQRATSSSSVKPPPGREDRHERTRQSRRGGQPCRAARRAAPADRPKARGAARASGGSGRSRGRHQRTGQRLT